MEQIRKNYKDGVFRKLFNDKDKLIELYNALSGSHYPPDTDLKIVTLENSIFGDLKNDLAFIIDDKFIILVEHQSTINPNMALRMLIYLAKQYEKLYYSNEIYSTRRVYIPVPELYVFYNGIAEMPVEDKIKLSDLYVNKCGIMFSTRRLASKSADRAVVRQMHKALSDWQAKRRQSLVLMAQYL